VNLQQSHLILSVKLQWLSRLYEFPTEHLAALQTKDVVGEKQRAQNTNE